MLVNRNGFTHRMGPFTRLGLQAQLSFAYQFGAVITETFGIEEE